jgi:hypothetical protein
MRMTSAVTAACGERLEAAPAAGRPALFDQRHQQRAGLFERAQALSAAGGGVGVALHGGVGGDDQHVARAGGGAGSRGARLDHAHDGHRHGILNGVQSQRAGRVAGDHQKLRALLTTRNCALWTA